MATRSKNAGGSNDERSRYDMEQAYAMRRAASSSTSSSFRSRAQRRSPPPLPPSSSSEAEASSAAETAAAAAMAGAAEDVRAALAGLDAAESLSSDPSRWEESMRLYELSIERLIRFLNSTKDKRIACRGVSREVLAERVRAALTEAEGLKAKIKSRGGRTTTQPAAAASGRNAAKVPARKPERRPEKRRPPASASADEAAAVDGHGSGGSWGVSSVASALSAAFGGRSSSSRSLGAERPEGAKAAAKAPSPAAAKAASPTATGAGGPVPTPTPGYAAATASSSSSRRRAPNGGGAAPGYAVMTTTTRPSSYRSKPGSGPAAAVAAAKRKKKRRPRLDYASDPLVKAVKSDLYVDSSSIATRWDDVAGLDDAKRSMQEAAILPLLRPDLYTGLRVAPRGILLYGPPGTGKTMLVKAVARESKCILFACTASSLTSKWHGEGEKLVRTLFRMASDVAPSILFFDEIDALLGRRTGDEHEASRRFKTEFMVQMDGIVAAGGGGGGGTGTAARSGADRAGDDDDEEDDDEMSSRRVLVLGCTNCPWDLDDAVLRRFQRRIYVPLPDAAARRSLLESMLRRAGEAGRGEGGGHDLGPRQVSRLVTLTEGYSCSDIASIGAEAAFGPLRELGDVEAVRDVDRGDVRPVRMGDFERAIADGKRSVSNALLGRYGEWEREQAGTAALR